MPMFSLFDFLSIASMFYRYSKIYECNSLTPRLQYHEYNFMDVTKTSLATYKKMEPLTAVFDNIPHPHFETVGRCHCWKQKSAEIYLFFFISKLA